MLVFFRLIAVFVVFAHLWVGALPCAPRSDDSPGGRVLMSVGEAEGLLQLARATHDAQHADVVAPAVAADASGPPCHDVGEMRVTPRPAIDGALLFLLPACPCGCDQRAPMGGSSTVRVGSGVPPAALLARSGRAPVVPFHQRIAAAPLVSPALPDPVPRHASLV